jgi:DNA-binding transcriptional LysR family regulator
MRTDPQRLPPLDLLAAFESAGRHLSFTKAGEERFVTQSAISRQIRALEEELGVSLFRRGHRALALTEDGRRLLETCASVFAQLRGTMERIRAPGKRQGLALTTTPGLASLWLIPRLPSFTRKHPGIDVRIDASYERHALTADGFDVAIRYGRANETQGTPLFRESTLPVCSPRLLRDKSRPLAMPSDLRLHTLLQVTIPPRSRMPFEWESWLPAAGLSGLRPASTLSFSNYDEAITAALSGQGVALGRRPLVDSLLKSGKLVAPFKSAVASPRAYVLIIEAGARSRPEVRAFERWLLAQARTGSVGTRRRE